MITRADALNIIEEYVELRNTCGKEPSALVESSFREFDYGWTFVIQTKAFVENGDYSQFILGSPVKIIDKYTGEIHSMGAIGRIEDHIEKYTKRYTEPPSKNP